MKKIYMLIMAVFLVCILSFNVGAIDLKTEIKQDFDYTIDSQILSGLTDLTFQISQDFGFDKYIYIEPNLEYSYTDEDTNLDFTLKECYFDLYLNKVDIRIGQQLVNWGTAYKFNPTDVINPTDYTASNPVETQLAVPAIKAKYFLDFYTEITGVLVADYLPSPFPSGISESNINKFENNIIQGIIDELVQQGRPPEVAKEKAEELFGYMGSEEYFVYNEAQEPELGNMENLEFGLQFTRRNFYGYDVSLSYFNGLEDLPGIVSDLSEVESDIQNIIYSLNNQLIPEATSLDMGYKRTQIVGANAIGSIKDFGFWTEASFSYNEDEEKLLNTVIGGDYTFENNLYTVVQYLFSRNQDYQVEQEDMNYFMVYADIPFRRIHKVKGTLIYDVENNSLVVIPEANFSFSNNIKFKCGAVLTSDMEDLARGSLLNSLGEEKIYVGFVFNL